MTQPLRKQKIMQPPEEKKTMQPEWVRKITQSLHTQKSCNLSMHKITQPFFFKSRNLSTKKNHFTSSQEKQATSAQTIKQPLHKKITQPPQTKTQKSRNLSTNKITQPLHPQNNANSQHKESRNLSVKKNHRKNRKTLPWEHHIGCQMCQITISKSSEKVQKNNLKKKKKNLNKKNYSSATSQKINFFFFFFSALLERAIWHIWKPIWCSQGSVLRV